MIQLSEGWEWKKRENDPAGGLSSQAGDLHGEQRAKKTTSGKEGQVAGQRKGVEGTGEPFREQVIRKGQEKLTRNQSWRLRNPGYLSHALPAGQ